MDPKPYNLHEIVKKQIHPQRVILWWGFLFGGIIGPLFSENWAGQTITVNDVHYSDVIIQFFVLKLQDLGMDSMWFQQDDVTCHTGWKTIHYTALCLSSDFQYWQHISFDLTSLDFFVWAQQAHDNQSLEGGIWALYQYLNNMIMENFIKILLKCWRLYVRYAIPYPVPYTIQIIKKFPNLN